MNIVLDAVRKAGVAAKEFIDGTAAQSKNLIIKNAFCTGILCAEEIKKSVQHGIVYFLRKSELYKLKSVVLRCEFTSTEHIRLCPNDGHLPPHLDVTPFDLECTGMMAFRRIMEEYNITPSMIVTSLLKGNLQDFDNPAKSGSLFFLTADDEYILKTVRDYEARFFQSELLNDYYHNLAKRKKSFLGRYFGMYAYTQRGSLLTFRFVIMSNIIPCSLHISERYDLKGSTKGRRALIDEDAKQQPTYKDLDFIDRHPYGLQLPPDVYDRLSNTLQEDVEILRGWNIIDYSLLIGIYNLSSDAHNEQPTYENKFRSMNAIRSLSKSVVDTSSILPTLQNPSPGWNLTGLTNERRQVGTAIGWNCPIGRIYPEDMSAARMYNHPVALTYGGIPAMNDKGQRLLIFLGIIDILQTYDASKQIQQFMQGMQDNDEYSRSIIDPEQYATRFLNFVLGHVFHRGQTDLGTTRMGSINYGRSTCSEIPSVMRSSQSPRRHFDSVSYVSADHTPTIQRSHLYMPKEPSYPSYSRIDEDEHNVKYRSQYSAPNLFQKDQIRDFSHITSEPEYPLSYPIIDNFPNADECIRLSKDFNTLDTRSLPPPLPVDFESKLYEAKREPEQTHIGLPPLPKSFNPQNSFSDNF